MLTSKSRWAMCWRKPRRRAMRCCIAKTIVQIGTQHRSEPYPQLAHESGAAWGAGGGQQDRDRVELSRSALARAAGSEADSGSRTPIGADGCSPSRTRPFDPQLYFEFRLYKEFSSGIPDQWMSHGIDLVHYFMDDDFPEVGGGAWRRIRVARWARESGYVPGAARNIPRDSSSVIRPASATTRPASRGTWGRRRRLMNIGGEGSPR